MGGRDDTGTGGGNNPVDLEALGMQAATSAEIAEQMGHMLERGKELSRLEEQKVTWASRTNKELKEQLNQQDKILVQLQQQTAELAKGLKIDEAAIEKLEKSFRELGRINPKLKEKLLLEIASAKNALKSAGTEEEKLKLLQSQKDVWRQVNHEIQLAGAHTEDAEKFVRKANSAAGSLAKSMGVTANVLDTKIGGGIKFMIDAFQGMKTEKMGALRDAAFGLVNPMNIAANLLGKMAENAIALDKASVAFQRATGFAGDFRGQINSVYSSTVKSGVSMQEAGAALGSLAENFSGFNPNAKAVNENMTETVALLSKVGVGAGESAKMMDTMNKAMGMGAEKSADMTRQVIRAGSAIGISSKKMAADWSSNYSKIASFGNQTIGVFKDLAAQSKATGVAMGELVSIGAKFDTFKGAAEVSGQLNAILGTQFSALEMVNMNYGERVEKLRSEIEMVGGGFGAMDRYTQLAVAQAGFGGDMAKAQKVLNMSREDYLSYENDMAASAETQKQLAEATEKMVPVMEKLQLAFAKLAANEAVVSMLDGMAWVITGLAENMNGIMITMAALGSAWLVYSTFMINKTAALAAAKAAEAAGISLNTKAWIANQAAQQSAGKKILMLAAILGILAAVWHATRSPAFYLMPLVVAGYVFLLGKALDTVQGPALVAALVLSVLSAAISLVFFGLSAVIESVSGLFELFINNVTILPQVAAGVWMIAGSIGALGIASMMALTAVAAIMLAMTSIVGVFVLAGITEAMTSLGSLADDMTKLGSGMNAYAAGVASIMSLAAGVSSIVGDGFLAASVEGGKTSVVMSGDAGILTNLTSEKLTVDVNIPEIKIPQPIVNVYINGEQLDVENVVMDMLAKI